MPSKKKKQSFFSKIIPTTPKAKAVAVVAVFALIGGGIMVYSSFAATPNYTSGKYTWNGTGTKRYSQKIVGDGSICIDHHFDYQGFKTGSSSYYKVRVQQFKDNAWRERRESVSFGYYHLDPASKDKRTCWSGLEKYGTYRVQFDPIDQYSVSAQVYATLRFKVWGYNVNTVGNKGDTKNP